MAKKTTTLETVKEALDNMAEILEDKDTDVVPTPRDLEWGTYVLSQLDSTEFFNGNPTVDGLRRVTKLLVGDIVRSTTNVVQCPTPENNNRVTVVHIVEIEREGQRPYEFSGAADVSPDNVDAKYSKYPVALAETRAESRALRRALNLKVVAAEELEVQPESPNTEGGATSENVTPEQVKIIDLIGKRVNVNLSKFIEGHTHKYKNVSELLQSDGVLVINELQKLQSDASLVVEEIKGYKTDWRTNES